MRRVAGDALGLWKALEPWVDLAEEIDLAGMYQSIDAGEMRATEGLRYRDVKSSPWWVYSQVHKLAHPLIMALMQERDLGVLGKSFDRASRALVIRGSYAPRASLKWVAWYAKVADAVKVVKQAMRLPEQEGGFLVGPLEVINNSGKTGKELEPLVRSIEEVVESLKGLFPGIDRALYGRVMLTGAIHRQTNLAAWYTLAEDQVWVKVTGKYGELFRQSLAHELTHRWWRKFADKSIKEAWHKHHYSVGTGATVAEIKIGDTIPVKLRGVKSDPVVTGEKPGVWLVTAPELEGHTAQVSKYDLYKVMYGNAQKLSYPTVYSASDPEEHFCDAVGLWSTGDLKEPHLSAIRKIVS